MAPMIATHLTLGLCVFRPNQKNMYMFRVTRPYLNLLVKPIIFFRFSGKNIILCILNGEIPFKIYKIISFARKKIVKKNMQAYPT